MSGGNGQVRRCSREAVGIDSCLERGESSHWGRRGEIQQDHDQDRASKMGEREKSKRQEEDLEFLMTNSASGAPPPAQDPAQPKHASHQATRRDGYTRLQSDSPGEGSSRGQQRLGRNGNPLVRGKRGWRDASPGPFPEYRFKMGPMFGLGDHMRERYQWGMDSYNLKQRRKERRGRGALDERKKTRDENGNKEDKERMTESEGKKATIDEPRRHEPTGERSSMRAQSSGSPLHADVQAERDDRARRDHYDKRRPGERARDQNREGRHQGGSGLKVPLRAAEHATRKPQAEIDACSREKRHARHETEAKSSPSGYHRYIGSRNPPNIEVGKSYTCRSSICSSNNHLDPQIPVYERTPSSQRVEARERAEARIAGGK